MVNEKAGDPMERPPQPARPAVGRLRLAGVCLRAVLHLIEARLQHRLFRTDDVGRRNRDAAMAGHTPAAERLDDGDMIQMIAWVIPRVAYRMPFRSDCLIQAMAAQSWLRECGIASRIVIGVLSQGDRPFESHAWLSCGNDVVIGGEVEAFRQILG